MGGGINAERASSAGALWGKERDSILSALANRAFSPCATLIGTPHFSVLSASASSNGTIGGEPSATIVFDSSSGPLHFEAGRGVLAAAIASLSQARAALGAS